MAAKRSHHADKLARVYDQEILPIWAKRFGKLLLRDLALPPKAMVLDVGCGTGYPSLEILRRMDEQGRIIAIDASSPMLDEARRKAGALSGKRIFFRSENAVPKLTFTNDVYDLTVCNAGLQEFEDPEAAIREFARVTKPDGRVVVTLPLAGTWSEFFDIFREVLIKHDRQDAIDRLDAYLSRFPPLEQAQAWFEDAGLADISAEYDTFTLLFRSAREFFFAPIVEYGPLADWKAIAGKGEQMQKAFWECKAAIDSYFPAGATGGSFAVTVVVGCVRGRKKQPEQARLHLDRDDDEEASTGEIQLVTGEFDILEAAQKELEDEPEDEEPDEGPIL
jgi:ubiquinone/menaquinone biosynthesis C-methylase UbiE